MTSHLATNATLGAGQEPTRRAVVLFVRMWVIAHVLHLLIANHTSLDTPWNITVVALAMALLLKPQSGRLFVAMMLAQLVEYAAEMPFGPDHWALVALVNLAILGTMLANRSTSLETLPKAFPAARLILLTAYGAAALSKWNTSFLDPVTSCANVIAKLVTFNLVGPLGDSPVLNVGAAVTEALVFLFLAIPRTRTWGVLLGLAFHFTLSASPVMVVGDFTSTVYALFFLFLRPEIVGDVLDRISRLAGRSGIVRDARRRPTVTLTIVFAGLGFGGYAFVPAAMATLYVLEQFYFAPLLIATVMAVRASRAGRAGTTVGRIRLIHVPVLALALVWAMSPYLGLRTTGVFTMFSNIRTESPAPNHLFMPSFRLTDWQEDMVTLKSSNDAELQSGVRSHLAVPLMALRRMSTDNPALEVTGVLHGQTITFGPSEGQTELKPLPVWQYKLFLLRPVTTDEPFCSPS